MAASSSSSAVTPSDTTAGPVDGDAFRRILDSAIEAAPSKLLVSALAEKMTDAQLEELNEAKRKQERKRKTDAQVEELNEAKRRRERKPTSFDDLPDEIVVKIFQMASTSHDWRAEIVKIFQMASTKTVWFAEKYNHGFIVRVLSKVSIRFRQLATNYSLWKGLALVGIDPCWPSWYFNTSEWEYVVQKCLNSGTRRFVVFVERWRFVELWGVEHGEHADPTTRFPKLEFQFAWDNGYDERISDWWYSSDEEDEETEDEEV